jgi:hypothetical protein
MPDPHAASTAVATVSAAISPLTLIRRQFYYAATRK